MAEDPVTQAVDPEPSGTIEVDVKPGTKEKVVPLAALTAERERIRKTEREKFDKEMEPLKTKVAQADQLAADLQALQPQLEHLKKHPELLAREEPPAAQQIPDAEAETFARQFELYTAQGLDIPRARRIMASQRAEIEKVAKAAAAEAIRPVAERTALDQSRANFLTAAQALDQSGRPLVDPQVLAQQWALVPAELSAQREVADMILDRAIGVMHRLGRQAPAVPTREPVFSEPAGGRGRTYEMSDLERRVANSAGITPTEWTKTAKTFVPGAINVIGETGE